MLPLEAGVGRPTDCTPDVIAIIAKARGAGLSWTRSAAKVGLSHTTMQTWRARAETGEEPYASFLAACEKARTEWVERQLASIEVAGEDSWQARAWLLERTEPDDFGRRDRIEADVRADVKTEHSGEVAVTVSPRDLVEAVAAMSPEQLRALAGPLDEEDPERDL